MLRTHTKDASWATVAAVVSNMSYALVPLVVAMTTDDWSDGDYSLLVYLVVLAISSAWFHGQLVNDDQSINRPNGGWAQRLDDMSTSLVVTTLFFMVVAGDAIQAVIWAPLLLLAAEFALVYCVGTGSKNKFDVVALILLVIVLLVAGLQKGDRDATRLWAGAISLITAGVCWWKGTHIWGGEGHAWWHVSSAVAIALIWSSCHA